ncbi:hypothetical protein EVAR_68815_1 [Eumeta japonica]|uniref:Uncharacterized protein n=1 Tax=Eumeta variegata TaxID=151549 RepID=A0A4C1Z1T2_EUMVA|nr:hypothetical protein EVAR_68815_1 [Eumeta japonica]
MVHEIDELENVDQGRERTWNSKTTNQKQTTILALKANRGRQQRLKEKRQGSRAPITLKAISKRTVALAKREEHFVTSQSTISPASVCAGAACVTSLTHAYQILHNNQDNALLYKYFPQTSYIKSRVFYLEPSIWYTVLPAVISYAVNVSATDSLTDRVRGTGQMA